MKKNMAKDKTQSLPPHQYTGFRIMFEKLDTTVNPHTNRDPTLQKIKLRKYKQANN